MTDNKQYPTHKEWNQATGRDGKLYTDGWNACVDAYRAMRAREAAPYVAGPKTRAAMEEWLMDGTLIDRVAEVLAQQENEIIRLEKLVGEQPAPSQDAEDAKRLREALNLAVDHIDMDALEVSHCKDAAAIRAARAQKEGK